MSELFPHVFSPFKFRTFDVKNRLVLPPMCIYVPGSNGYVHPRVLDYYEARAAGGVGYIVINASSVSADGSSHPNMTSLMDDRFIPGYAGLVETIHRYGVKVASQFHHAGRQRYQLVAGGQTMSPDGRRDPIRKDPAKAPTIAQIQQIVEDFAQAARRAKEAGVDAVEIHCAHGYLLSGFLSPFQNQRQDEYGGDVWRRTRIVREIIARSRELVGPDILIQVRINGSDYVNGGNTVEDAQQIAKILVDAGAEAIHVSAGMAPSGQYSFLPAPVPKGVNVPLAEAIKKVVSVPVIAVGSITDVPMAEEILSRGTVDLVAIGRAMFADPDLPNKSRAGRLREVRPCLRCSKCAGTWPEDPRCVANPAAGFEAEYKNLRPAETPKKVVVVGAGPGGLEAARTAALRGHSVKLFETDDKIGGKVHLAKRIPEKGDLDRWLDYYENEMQRLGVQVILNRRVVADDIVQEAPDAVVVATGGTPLVPKGIQGTDHPRVVVADDVLWDRVEVGQKVCIVGGSSMGVETAEYLTRKGKSVVVVEQLHEILMDISHDAQLALLDTLIDADFRWVTEALVTGIVENGDKLDVQIKRYTRERVLHGFDSVVLAVGVAPENRLGSELKGKLGAVYLVGDSQKGGDFRKAVHDGAKVGLQI